MTRACLIHALHPDENESVILRVSYVKSGLMRVGVEAIWRAASTGRRGDSGSGSRGGGGGGGGDGASLQGGEEEGQGPRMLSGWDRDMPAVGPEREALCRGFVVSERDSCQARQASGFIYSPTVRCVTLLSFTADTPDAASAERVDALLCPFLGLTKLWSSIFQPRFVSVHKLSPSLLRLLLISFPFPCSRPLSKNPYMGAFLPESAKMSLILSLLVPRLPSAIRANCVVRPRSVRPPLST